MLRDGINGLWGGAMMFCILIAMFIKLRRRRVESEAIYFVVGVNNEDGYGEVLDFWVGGQESSEIWKENLKQLKSRGSSIYLKLLFDLISIDIVQKQQVFCHHLLCKPRPVSTPSHLWITFLPVQLKAQKPVVKICKKMDYSPRHKQIQVVLKN